MVQRLHFEQGRIYSNYACLADEMHNRNAFGPIEHFVRKSFRRRIELLAALNRFLDDLASTGGCAEEDECIALQSYDFLLRKWSEFMDLYQEKQIRTAIENWNIHKESVSAYVSKAKKARDGWAEISNLLKHNDRFLNSLQAVPDRSNLVVRGYCIMETSNGVDRYDAAVHSKRRGRQGFKHEAFSYHQDVHSLMTAALRTDIAFGRLLHTIGRSDPEEGFRPFFDAKPFERISSLPRVVFPWETARSEGISIEADTLTIGQMDFTRPSVAWNVTVFHTVGANRSHEFART